MYTVVFMSAKKDPGEFREATTVRIERRKLAEINEYCKRNNLSRSLFLSNIICDHMEGLKANQQ